MSSDNNKIDVLPWFALGAVFLAVVALSVAIVALGKSKDKDGDTPQGMAMSMGGHGMEHMAPVSIDGIKDATVRRGNTELRGVRRNGALEFKLDARPVWWKVLPDQRVAAWAYNGMVPGPMIRVRNGERVRIRFQNDLPEKTTIHWHGIGVPNSQDGVPDVTQKPVEPGQSFTYEFTARPAGDSNGGGTFLYHSHQDEDRQMSVGLSGVFIVDPAEPAAQYDIDKTLVVSEWTVDPSSGRTRGAMEMEGMFPNYFTINGKSFPATEPVEVKTGQRVLLRLVNAGQFSHPLHLHGTAFRIVARDGHPTRDRGLRDTVSLESGERADISFTSPRGKWLFHCHIGHHLTNDGESPGGLITLVNAT